MARRVDPSLTLRLADWPAAWQRLWAQAIIEPESLLSEDGGGAHWRPETRRQALKTLELFFGALARRGVIDPAKHPSDYLIVAHLRPFIEELRDRVAPVTAASRLRDLSMAFGGIEPKADRSLPKEYARRLESVALPSRDRTYGFVGPDVTLGAGIRRMNRTSIADYEKEDVRAVQYGDGLALCILSVAPIRLSELCGLRIEHSFRRTEDHYLIDLPRSEVKGGTRARRDMLPVVLTPYVDLYIDVYRRKLLGDRTGDTLFISCYRQPMSKSSMHARIVTATTEEIGIRINPHGFRHIAGTYVALHEPARVALVSEILNHLAPETAREHYIHAGQLSASRAVIAEILRRREAALGATNGGELFPRR